MKSMLRFSLLGALIALIPATSFAADDFANYNTGLDSPLYHGVLVSPNDSVDLAKVTRACLVGTTGDVKVTTAGGETLVVPSVPVGWHPFRVSRIWSTGTTASNISCWW
jgi:hypothetical protein